VEELMKAYFEQHEYIDEILSVDAVIENDEQFYRVEFENNCLNTGRDYAFVSVSDLLVFLHSGEVNY